jgi:type I restriction enzyme S subunit
MKEGWKVKKLDEICIIKGRIGYRGYTKQDLVNEGEGAISLSPSDIKNNKLFFKNCTYISWKKYEESPEIMIFEGDIIFCKTASIGKMAIVEYLPEKATLNPQFVVLKQINCDNKYLYYFMNSEEFKEQVKNIIGGTAIPTLSQKNLGNLNLPIPPLKEQQQIVAILDQAFEAIDQAKANIEKNIANSKELFKSNLNDIFSQKGDGWEEKKLNEICEVKDGTHDSPKYISEENGIPFVTQKNILNDGISFANTKFISKENHDDFYKRSNVAFNDILFSMIGANRGMACIVDDNRVFSIKNVGLIKSSENYRPKFILYFFKSLIAEKYVSENSSGSAQGFVSLGKLRTFPIPFTNIENQKKIESTLESLNDAVNSTITNYQRKLNNLEDLKKSILQKAFAGELTNKEIEV